jgi:hypothetical protein
MLSNIFWNMCELLRALYDRDPSMLVTVICASIGK